MTAGLAQRLATGTPVLLVSTDGPAALPSGAVTRQTSSARRQRAPVIVTGTRRDLLAWLLGRTTAASVHATRGQRPVPLPDLTPWA